MNEKWISELAAAIEFGSLASLDRLAKELEDLPDSESAPRYQLIDEIKRLMKHNAEMLRSR